MRRAALLLLFASASAAAQDSSFTALRVRASVLRLPAVGAIRDDWRPKTGAQVDIASNVGRNEIGLAVGHVGFEPITGKPAFTETMFSLGWTRPILAARGVALSVGARLTDVRMDFDDPALVGGLRTEEEQLLAAMARGRLLLGRGYSGFAEGSYGVLMTSTRTPTVTLAIGVERDGAMPRWLRDFLR